MKNRHNHYPIRKSILVLTTLFLLGGCYAATNIGNKETYYTPNEETLALGKELYNQYCVACHGDEMKGDGPEASLQEKQPTDLTAKGVHLTQTSIKGVLDYPHYSHEAIQDKIKYGNEVMHPLKEVLSNADIEAITQYISATIRAGE